MFTQWKRLAISLVLAVLLALPPVALAQEATAQTQEWSNLKTITPGSKLDVTSARLPGEITLKQYSNQ